jgi:chromosome segregation ATPase
MLKMAVYKKNFADLIRTSEILKKQLEDVKADFINLEKSNQVIGYRGSINGIQESSAVKTEHDDSKFQMLAELSQIEMEIQKQIQARNEELKPIVAQIQEKKKEKAEIEIKFLQAQARFEQAIREYDQSIVELEDEIKKYQKDITSSQSKYFTVQGLFAIQERQIKRANDEANANESRQPISKKIQTYSDCFHKEVRRLRKENNTLKEKKDQAGGQSADQMKQLEMFNTLKRLLQIKEESQKKELAHQREAIDIAEKEKVQGNNLDLR